jgi:hypothetical protein
VKVFIRFLWCAFALMLLLQLSGAIRVSWWWVFAPLIVRVVLFILGLVSLFGMIAGANSVRRQRSSRWGTYR